MTLLFKLSLFKGIWGISGGKDYSKLPLTYEILSDVGKIAIITIGSNYMVDGLPQSITFEFKVNDGQGQEYEYSPNIAPGQSASEPEIILDNLVKGDIVEFRSNNNQGAVEDYESEDGTCVSIQPFYNDLDFDVPTWANVYGNILSLFPENPYDNENVDLLLNRFFCGSTIKSAENLILPDFPNIEPGSGNRSRGDMFSRMFYFSYIEKAPKKIASKVAGTRFCRKMFEGCENLITTPDITSIVDFSGQAFQDMFRDCSSLTKTPVLPKYMYFDEYSVNVSDFTGMFAGCSNLSGSIIVPIGNAAGYNDGLQYGPSEMFSGCENLEQCIIDCTGPVGTDAFYKMFENCENLKFIDVSKITEVKSGALTDWLKNAGGSNSVIKIKSGVTYPSGDSGIPSNGTVQEI